MKGVNFRGLKFMLLIAFLVWSSNIESCSAKIGKHGRHSRGLSSSLFKKKGKNHGSNNHHSSGSKSKSEIPSPKAPPRPQEPPSPPTKPKKNVPALLPEEGHDSGSSATFDVVRGFGAKGDGKTDDTKAFQAAWAAACNVATSTMVVPSELVFLVGPISFSGPCQHNIVFQLDGTIIAPTSPEAWSSDLLQWLEFTKLVYITIQGQGTIDGRGSVWWQDYPVDDETKMIVPLNHTMEENKPIPIGSSNGGKMPSKKPTALRFFGSSDVTVSGITIKNSQKFHLKFDSCTRVSIFNMNISSPGDSPNTNGIHLQDSTEVLIHSTNLACGDDCVSIQTGCANVTVHNVNCGPGHGISIGGLGEGNSKACVSNITVRDIFMQNTTNGVRIKTWQGGSGSVRGVQFSNIQVCEVKRPIVIDQFYCDKGKCENQTSAVALSGIHYERISGNFTVQSAYFACSDSMPCTDVSLTAIELRPQEGYNPSDPYCWQTFGEILSPTVPPIHCVQMGKPSRSKTPTDLDSC